MTSMYESTFTHPNMIVLGDTGRHHVNRPGKTWIGFLFPDMPLPTRPAMERLAPQRVSGATVAAGFIPTEQIPVVTG